MRAAAVTATVAVAVAVSVAVAGAAAGAAGSDAKLCAKWLPAQKQGELDSKIIDESSGLSISRAQDAYYHMNDSGTGPEFHVTKPDGTGLYSVHVEGYTPRDPEETSMGPCPLKPEKTCLVIEDIGDNHSRRKDVAFVFIEEQTPWPKSVKPELIARATYPDGAHNAEAATLLDNGDIVLFTKELDELLTTSHPARVFRLKRQDYKNGAAKFERIGTLDIPALNKQSGLGGVATGIASTPDGRRWTILTYAGAMEFSIDLKQKFPEKITAEMWREVPLYVLPQQESIAYDRGDRDLVYSTEAKLAQRFFGHQPVPMYKVKCSL